MNDLTFSDLRLHCQTSRAFIISGTGQDRVYGYRSGVLCKLGDLERTEWMHLVKELISCEGEQELYQQLLQHLKDHNYAKETKSELEFNALQLHAARILDNEVWVDFLRFNRKYRPDVVTSARLVRIRPMCCKMPGEITQTILEQHKSTNTAPCPHCGRWAEYELMTTTEMEERTNECE